MKPEAIASVAISTSSLTILCITAFTAAYAHGEPLRARLDDTIRLMDGTELPCGTVLIGVIGNDEMRAQGGSGLTLRFTRAELSDGRVVPVAATIIGIAPSESAPTESDAAGAAVGAAPRAWSRNVLQMGAIGAGHGLA